jgi:hypothetical protein
MKKGPLIKALEKGYSKWETRAFGTLMVFDITSPFDKKKRKAYEFLIVPKRYRHSAGALRIELKNGYVYKVYVSDARDWFSKKKGKIVELSKGKKKLPFAAFDYLFVKIGELSKKQLEKMFNMPLNKLFSESANKLSIKMNDDGKKPKWLININLILDTLKNIIYLVFTILFLRALFRHLSVKKEVQIVERTTDEKLFQKIEKPLDEYLTLYYAVKNLVTNKHLNGLLVYGPPGTGKTFTVKYTLYKLGVPYVHYKGGAKTLEDLVSILYKHRKGKVIILDDFDSALNNPDAINILKAATDTYEKRIISLPIYRDTSFSDIELPSIPEQFVFTSKIIVITNKDGHELDKALLSRMVGIKIEFTNEQMLKIIRKVLRTIHPDVNDDIKLEVLKFVEEELLKRCPYIRVDFRLFKMIVDLRLVYPTTWKKMVYDMVCK